MTSAMEIKASEVQKLRQTTGAGLMDCKQALTETKGDMEKAIVLLRERGIAKSSKRADRVAAEGIVEAWISDAGNEGILLEINSETDFVARNAEFVALAKFYTAKVRDNASITSADQLPKEPAEELSGKVGEKISVRRFERMKAKGAGTVAAYIHGGSKLGVLLQIDSEKAGVPSEDMKNLGKELALQVAGANPSHVNRTEVPADVLEREKDIAKKQMEGQKKPPEILEKIAVGKLQQYYEAHCLLDQPHVRDASGKTKIQILVDSIAKKEGTTLRVVRFVRFRVGAD
jgi:elongation factor Ts